MSYGITSTPSPCTRTPQKSGKKQAAHQNPLHAAVAYTMNDFSLIQKIAVWAIPLLFAITVHEVAHGWVANRLGDPTAKMLGRLTLNPAKHIDPVGTIIVPGILLALGGFVFGWAKPVPVTWENLKNPKRDMALVAIAGPITNLLMALGWAFIAKIAILTVANIGFPAKILFFMSRAGIIINLVLMILNLLPIPPLDGSRVLASIVPKRMEYSLYLIEPYGFFILVALLATGILAKVIGPPIFFLFYAIANLFGLPIG